jgi:hypothetical protein
LNPLVLVVTMSLDVEVLFRQQFRRDLHAGRSPWSLPNPVLSRFNTSVMRPVYRSS